MKVLSLCALLLVSAAPVFAAEIGLTNQKDSLDNLNKDYAGRKCGITWNLVEKNLKLPSDASRGGISKLVGEIEYEVRKGCPDIAKKISKVEISCGTAAADYNNCTEAQNKDGGSVSMSGKTLKLVGKYANCACSADGAKEDAVKKKIFE